MEGVKENYFETIDTPLKAYIFGIVIYNIRNHDTINKTITIELSVDDCIKNGKYDNYYRNIEKIKNCLAYLGECVYNNNSIVLTIHSEKIINDIHNHLNITSLSSICYLDITHLLNNLKDQFIYNQFVKAYIERYGNISTENNISKLFITFYLEKNIEYITNIYNIPHIKNKLFNLNIAIYKNANLIDFMGMMYYDDDIPFFNMKLYNNFNNILNNNENTVIPRISVFRENKEAVLPSKCRESDAGYDITIIKESKRLTDKTVLYDTGIRLDIPNGYYVEIVPRSSISKSGYMLANSIGIIDQSYRGNIFVALTKINESSDDIKLPFKCCQMILKKQIYCKIVEQEQDFESTNRNIGGFGSTDVNK
jgi:deoxyuridine 5'-triphosphate nucleotidohydrolase